MMKKSFSVILMLVLLALAGCGQGSQPAGTGANGAGKSTLLRTISGLVRAGMFPASFFEVGKRYE